MACVLSDGGWVMKAVSCWTSQNGGSAGVSYDPDVFVVDPVFLLLEASSLLSGDVPGRDSESGAYFSSGSPASLARARTFVMTSWTSVVNAGFRCRTSSCSILSAKSTITVLILSMTPSSRLSRCKRAASVACLRLRNCCWASRLRSRRLCKYG